MALEDRIGDYIHVVLRDDKNELGKGFMGCVMKGKHVPSGDDVAVKRVELRDDTVDIGKEWNQKYIINEIEILKLLDHENVIKLCHAVQRDKFMYLFIEFCKKGDLNKFISKKRVLTKELAFRFILHISEALVYLHEHDPLIVHRDVKPANFLVHGDSDSNYSIKITDFGFSKRAPRASTAFVTHVGSPNWMAPEVLPDQNDEISYNKETDVFSAGLVFLAIIEHEDGTEFIVFKVNGKPLGKWMNENKRNSRAKPTPAIRKKTDDGHVVTIKGLILQMISADPEDRCSMRQVRDSIKIIYDTFFAATSAQPTSPPTKKPSAQSASPRVPKSSAQSASPRVPKPRIPSKPSAQVVASRPSSALTSPGATDDSSEGAPRRTSSSDASDVRPKTGGVVAKLKQKFGRKQPSEGQSSSQRSESSGASPRQLKPTKKKPGQSSANPTISSGLQVKKIGHINLGETGAVNLRFGQGNILAAFKTSRVFCHYKYESGTFKLIWQKPIPKGLKFDCNKYLSTRGDFFLQERVNEVCLYDQDMQITRRLPSPGWMICLLPGGERAVVDNYLSLRSMRDGIKLSVTSTANLQNVQYELEVPADGPYTQKDSVAACGLDDGRMVVVVLKKPFVDLYDGEGRHTVRAKLPGGAGQPSCTSSFVLVRLRDQPKCFVLSWTGQLVQEVDHTDLGLKDDDLGYAVSSVHEDRLSFHVATDEGHEIHTYQLQ